MSLLDVDVVGGTIAKLCDNCGAREVVDVKTIRLGAGDRARCNPDAMQMPKCSSCGATEFMLRTWDLTPEFHRGSPSCEQRAAKNALAQHLRSIGRQHESAKTIHAAEKSDPPEMMAIGEARNLRVVPHDRLRDHAARNAEVAMRTNTPIITFGGIK